MDLAADLRRLANTLQDLVRLKVSGMSTVDAEAACAASGPDWR